MSQPHILAIHTYGSQRVSHPETKETISAQKIGYSSAAATVLLALYGDQAQDVSSNRSSYRYIQIHAKTSIHYGYLLLNLSDAELEQAETICKSHTRAGAYIYRDGQWFEMPNQRQPDYKKSLSHSGPNFNPQGYRTVAPTSKQIDATNTGITIERSQRDPNKDPWYWVSGNTFPHRTLLKRYGGRWSKRRKAWYFITKELPEAIQTLVEQHGAATESTNATDKVKSSVTSESMSAKTLQVPAHRFELDQMVYADHDLESPAGQVISTGTAGRITGIYHHHERHGWIYEVNFAEIGSDWYFERELSELEPIPSIRITRGAIVPPGADQPLSDVEIKRALIENKHQPNLFKTTIINTTSDDAPCSDEEAEQILGVKLLPKPIPSESNANLNDNVQDHVSDVIEGNQENDTDHNIEDQAETEGTPRIQILKPKIDTELRNALQTIKPTNLEPMVVHPQTTTHWQLPQEVCGELTGSITGQVWCYGYAIHRGVCVFVSMGGPRMAIEAIRAKLGKGENVNLLPEDSASIELTAGEGISGMYSDYMQNIPEAKFTSLMLAHEMLVKPNYGGKSTSFIFHLSDAQAQIQLRQHVTRLVKIPIFEHWTRYLWQAGQAAKLIHKTRSNPALKIWAIELDIDAWTRLITGGLSDDLISLTHTDTNKTVSEKPATAEIALNKENPSTSDLPEEPILSISKVVKNVELAHTIHQAILKGKQHGWKRMLIKQRSIKRLIFEHVTNHDQVDQIYNIAFEAPAYDDPVPEVNLLKPDIQRVGFKN